MKRLLLILPIFLLFPLFTLAQVTVEAKLDTAHILIGQQVQLTVRCTAASSARVDFPFYQSQDTLTQGVEVISNSAIDTARIDEGRRTTLTRRYTITSFDSALYNLPPFELTVDGKRYRSTGRIGLKVSTVPVDTVHIDRFSGPHDVVDMAFTFTWRQTGMCLLALFLAVMAIILFVRLTDPRLITRRVVIPPPTPAHVTALSAIHRIKDAPSASKAYYMQLTEALRTYVEQRFSLNAREMTTAEIIEALTAVDQTEALAELQEVLSTADLVKFAKYEPDLSRQDRDLTEALRYIETTKHIPTEKPAPRIEYVNLFGGHQRHLRLAMKFGAWTLVLLATIVTAILLQDLYLCFG